MGEFRIAKDRCADRDGRKVKLVVDASETDARVSGRREVVEAEIRKKVAVVPPGHTTWRQLARGIEKFQGPPVLAHVVDTRGETAQCLVAALAVADVALSVQLWRHRLRPLLGRIGFSIMAVLAVLGAINLVLLVQ